MSTKRTARKIVADLRASMAECTCGAEHRFAFAVQTCTRLGNPDFCLSVLLEDSGEQVPLNYFGTDVWKLQPACNEAAGVDDEEMERIMRACGFVNETPMVLH